MIIINNRIDLLKLIPKDLIFAEIGVFLGQFSENILETCRPKELFLVDTFAGNVCSGDKDGNNIIFTDMNKSYENLLEKYKLMNNIKIVKDFSFNFLNNINDNYLDAVYIDADHSYEAVKKDLNLSYLKVKNGGYIMGHDYTEKMFPGVVKAVNEFCSEKNLEIFFLTRDGCPSYLIKKI